MCQALCWNIGDTIVNKTDKNAHLHGTYVVLEEKAKKAILKSKDISNNF